jgi:hypothetical protein
MRIQIQAIATRLMHVTATSHDLNQRVELEHRQRARRTLRCATSS